MNYKEALEAIAYGMHLTNDIEGHLRDLAIQALAPQECDVSKCEFYDFGYCRCGDTRVPQEVGYTDILCSESENCYYKQLHSQQKTFTLEEVREIITNAIENKCGNCGDCGTICLVNEFKECLLAEFEKEGK